MTNVSTHIIICLTEVIIIARKQFTTTIDEDIQKAFKEQCVIYNDKMNDVLEAFMESYINGEFQVEKIVKFKLMKTGR